MHHTRRGLAYVLMIISIIVFPTVLMVSRYHYTQDPNLRPLGITREALRAYGVPGSGVEMIVYVDWPKTASNPAAQHRLADSIADSFTSKGVEARLVFRQHDGAPQVTYVVGKSVIGPYSAGKAGRGITAAVEAYRMH